MFKDYPRIIAPIRVPTLVIQGKLDPYIPINQATRLRDTIPNCKLAVINNGAHFLPIDSPDEVAQRIGVFLSAKIF